MRDALATERVNGIYDRIASRYDLLHGLMTLRSDARGRRLVVSHAVQPGDDVLDCGSGTGSTAIMAAERAGPEGQVTLFDLSEGMLSVAKKKAERLGLEDRVSFQVGNMLELPFEDERFDSVLSTYSTCPLVDPSKGALELYRVVRAGGRAGFAHSTEPPNPIVRRLANWVESIAWKFPTLSMGCRAVSVLPALESAGARLQFRRLIGVPLWPFEVFVVGKPA